MRVGSSRCIIDDLSTYKHKIYEVIKRDMNGTQGRSHWENKIESNWQWVDSCTMKYHNKGKPSTTVTGQSEDSKWDIRAIATESQGYKYINPPGKTCSSFLLSPGYYSISFAQHGCSLFICEELLYHDIILVSTLKWKLHKMVPQKVHINEESMENIWLIYCIVSP